MAHLTHEQLLELLHYDPISGLFYWRQLRGCRNENSIAGSSYPGSYVQIGVNGTRYLAHRLAWFYMTGQWPDHEVDHDDKNKQNNKWKNLRDATRVQNSWNIGVLKTNTSGYTGVSYDKARGKFMAYISIDGKRKSLGYHNTAEIAAKVRDDKAKEIYGKFYRSNKVNDDQG